MKSKISVLFIGDVVGEPGLNMIKEHLAKLKEQYKADFTIVNGENSCEGKGITDKEASIIIECGADIVTTGNHVWDNWKSKTMLAENPKVIRPINYPQINVGEGFKIVEIEEGIKIAVLQLQGRTYMHPIDCPFRGADKALKKIENKTNIIIVDFHADASAEKKTMGLYLDGKVSAVLGTHIHTPTADACIMPQGTAYISDVGMTGPYDSSIGLRKDIAIKRMQTMIPQKFECGEGDEKICGVNVIIDAETGQAESIKQIIYPDFIRSVLDQL